MKVAPSVRVPVAMGFGFLIGAIVMAWDGWPIVIISGLIGSIVFGVFEIVRVGLEARKENWWETLPEDEWV